MLPLYWIKLTQLICDRQFEIARLPGVTEPMDEGNPGRAPRSKLPIQCNLGFRNPDSCLGLLINRMQTAFLFPCVFPPPASFALVLAGQSRAGTGFTTNTDKPPFVQ